MGNSFIPRPSQKSILDYREGTLGVSAVPGSGKTWTLSLLAAELIRNGCLEDGQEILVVTLVNSAVHNFSQRISKFLEGYGLIPSLGYRVRTLHGLAHDIVKERPELAGLDNNFQIIDEKEATRIREDAVIKWFSNNPGALDDYLISDLSDYRRADLKQSQIPNLLNQIALQFIRTAKNLQLSPDSLEKELNITQQYSSLLRFGLEIYQEYQKNLAFRGSVDFDDLIIKAFQVLSLDPALLTRLQQSWPYILEDESQDSSLIQQQILSLIADQQTSNNWVRVGDPNQAIYESFTTADPQLLIDFINSADLNHSLPNSGRSSIPIINLANYLVDWSINEHPTISARKSLSANYIQPTPPGDSQPNPQSGLDHIHFYQKPLDPDQELALLARSVSKWLQDNPESTAAILAPRNERGKRMSTLLRDEFNIEAVELLSSTLATRKAIGALVKIISALLDPGSPSKLSSAFLVIHRDQRADPELWSSLEDLAKLIKSNKFPETYLHPGPGLDWLDSLQKISPKELDYLQNFRDLIELWQLATQLPIDQLILTIALEIFDDPSELELAHKLAAHEKQLSNSHPDWELPALLDELRSLARNERRFYSGKNDEQFNPDDHRGKVVVTTAHKAKGLEWDRVYLMSANNYNFPSGSDQDRYISEKWFIRDHLNLPAETLKQLESIASNSAIPPTEGSASLSARVEYIQERLRLFYVSITRAKRDLIITWNTGRSKNSIPCEAFNALAAYKMNIENTP